LASQKGIIIENAQQFAAKGKIDKAIAEWKKLIAETPQDGNIYNNISDLYLRVNDKSSAIDACLKAASAYRDSGFELKGVAVLKKILKIDPNRIDIYEMLADINADRGLVGNAIDGYQQTAKLYVKNGNFKGAVGVYQKLLRFTPEDPEIPLAIARLHQKQERFREAILYYEQAEAIYENKNMVSDAHQIVEEIIKIDPSYLKHLVAKEASVAALGGVTISIDRDVTLPPPKSIVESTEPLAEETNAESFFSDEMEIFRDIIPEDIPLQTFSSEPPSSPKPVTEDIFSSQPSIVSRPLTESKEGLVSDLVLSAHLSEAESYLKYGLNQNAIEKLRLVIQLSPMNEKAYLQLRDAYLKEGEKGKAVMACVALVDIYEKNRAFDKKEALIREVHEIDPLGEYTGVLELESKKTVSPISSDSGNSHGSSQ
jgi:tetratricopeptide (TPR) repeat protein